MKKNPRILVIDDEISIRRLLKHCLQQEHYDITEAASALEGLSLAASTRPAVIILDLGLPDLPGLTVLKRLREWSQAQILVLTVQDGDHTKVDALDSGADDYLTKPFSVPELLARLRVMERRIASAESEQTIIEDNHLKIDLSARQVHMNQQEVHLTATEYDLLRILTVNAGRVVTQRQLLKEVWGPNAVEHSQYLRVYIGQLRKKLEPSPASPQWIITEPGVGYRLVFKKM